LDNPLQQGTMDWKSLAPIARLMSVGSVLVQYDEQYARYDPPRPALLRHYLATTPPGLGRPVYFGTPRVNRPTLPLFDETYFDLPPGLPRTHPLAVYRVPGPRPIARADGLAGPIVLAGDNVGIVSAADVGLLAHDPTILFAGVLDTNSALRKAVLSRPAELVVTDTNRKQAFEWNSLAENTGYTETASAKPTAFVVNDPGFDMFPGAPVSAMTTSVLSGIRSVTASSYGTAFTLRSEDRPANAIDGNPATAWETEGTVSSPLIGQWWQVTARHMITADSVTLSQPQPRRNAAWLTNQFITRATLTFDGRHPITVRLGPQSRTAGGQVFAFPRRRFQTMRIRIDRTNMVTGNQPMPVGASLVGFATVRIGDLRTTQIISMPTDLLNRTGAGSQRDRLVLIMTRNRVAPVPPRSDPEPFMIRQFRLPVARSFSLAGTARLSNLVPDNLIDTVVGRTNRLVVSATSSSRMPGNLWATASSTLDGNPKTVWMPGLGDRADVGSWLQYRFRHVMRIDHLTLSVSSDAQHSRPTAVLVSAGGVTRKVVLPKIPVVTKPGSVTSVPLSFPAVAGSTLRITFSRIALRYTLSYETSLKTALPIGIAGVSIPGVPLDHLPERIPARCHSDLLRIDGQPVPIRITGTTAAALGGHGLAISTCGGARSGIPLGAGSHLLQAANGAVTGINIDQLALDSAPGGRPMTEPGNGSLAPTATSYRSRAPSVSVLSKSATSIHLRVSGATAPFLLVLGESLNNGWQASVAGGAALQNHFLIDGFANGWFVKPGTSGVRKGHPFDVTLSYLPQQGVDLALLLSVLGLLACLLVVFGSLVRARRSPSPPTSRAEDHGTPGLLPALPALCQWSQERSQVHDWRRVGLGCVIAGLLALLLAGPLAGLIVAVACLVAMTVPWGQMLLCGGAGLVMIAAALEVVRHQYVNRYLPGGGWPAHFGLASSLVWLAVVLLGAHAGIEAIRERRRLRRALAGEQPGEHAGERAAGKPGTSQPPE
ncbi:MAG: discoidin domain-containing protein, partial [Acidimicrobiales bacterium]